MAQNCLCVSAGLLGGLFDGERAFHVAQTVARVARFRNLKPYDNLKQQPTTNANKTPKTQSQSGKEALPPRAGGGTRTRTPFSRKGILSLLWVFNNQ